MFNQMSRVLLRKGLSQSVKNSHFLQLSRGFLTHQPMKTPPRYQNGPQLTNITSDKFLREDQIKELLEFAPKLSGNRYVMMTESFFKQSIKPRIVTSTEAAESAKIPRFGE